MRIGDIYRDSNSYASRIFVVINTEGPYVYVKYYVGGKLRSGIYPRRELEEDKKRYTKVGYVNLEKSITDALKKWR